MLRRDTSPVTSSTRKRPARTGRKPQTGEGLSISASAVPALKPVKGLNDAVNDGVVS